MRLPTIFHTAEPSSWFIALFGPRVGTGADGTAQTVCGLPSVLFTSRRRPGGRGQSPETGPGFRAPKKQHKPQHDS